MTNQIPEELTKDFCELELKIADVLMTYTKNRTQQPDPLYYQAVCNAAQQMFVQLEELIVAESFEDESEEAGDCRYVTFDMHNFEQMGIASYIEAHMLMEKIVDALIEVEPCWGEKIAIKYGYFENSFDEVEAIFKLMVNVSSSSCDASAAPLVTGVTLYSFGKFLKETLEEKMKNLSSWKEKDAVYFFKVYLKSMQPTWADEYNWHIASIDLYEWFCLKNNLTFHQFKELYDINSDDEKRPLCRFGAYALRYPSEINKTLKVLSGLQEYARKHPENPYLKFVTEEGTLFMDNNLKPVEELAILGTESIECKSELDWHYHLYDRLKNLVNWKFEDGVSIRHDTTELRRLYGLVCFDLEISPMLIYTGRDGTPEFDESTEEPFSWNDDEQDNEYRKKNFKWIVRTTLDPFYSCKKQNVDFDELCNDLVRYADYDVTRESIRETLLDDLTVELSDAFEEKLAEKLAYDIFVRVVEEEEHFSRNESYCLRVAIACEFAENGTESHHDVSCNLDEEVVTRLRKIFADHPLIANQLLIRIQRMASIVCSVDRLRPVSHHYFLAEEIRDLFDAARESVWIEGGWIGRQKWGLEKVYAMYGGIVDELYRGVCRQFNVQPCVDISRVM